MPSTIPRVGPDIGPILNLVRKTRLLLRGSWGISGVAVTLGLASATLAVVTAGDMLVPLVSPWLRLVGLILFAAPTLVVFVRKCVLPLSRRIRDVEIARRIESHIPGMHSRLVSCIDFAEREDQVSPAFYRKLVDESLDRIGTYRSSSVVDHRAIWKNLRFALIGTGVFALLWLGLGSRLTTAMARVFNPFADLPPASDVEYSVEPGTAKVLQGDDIAFVVTVSRGEPESLTLELAGNDAVVRHPLKKESDGVWRLTLRGLSSERGFEKGFTYRVFGGRTWTKRNRIDWVARPAVGGTTIKVHLPDYMAIRELRVNPAKERDVVGPVGSRVEIAVEVEGDVAAGVIHLQDRREARVVPLDNTNERTWTASFPLTGAGQYRIELQNELGHANKAASEVSKYEAIFDQPPIAIVERPGSDLILSKAERIPITIAVRDDYGLLELWIATQREGERKFSRTVRVKDFATPNPLKVDALVAMLDLTPSGFNLKPGDTLRYRAEVRDRRPNSEAVFSKDFTIRIVDDPNAADKLLEAFEKNQDTFRDKLANLVAEQRKIKEKIDQVQVKYDALNTKLFGNRDGVPAGDPKDAGEMAALRKDLADLFAQEKNNVATGSTLGQELKNLAALAQKNPLVDAMINKEMQDLSGRFKSTALDPLQELANKLQQGTNPAQSIPDLKNVKNQSDRVQKNLESMKNRIDALANAQKSAKIDVDKALAKLKEDLLKEHGRATAMDLEALKDHLKNLREELAKLQGNQEDLLDDTDKASETELPEVEKKQATLDELLKKQLDLAKKIFEREKTRNLLKQQLPDDPFTNDPKERKGTPKENKTPPDPKNNENNPSRKLPPIKKDRVDDEEDLFKPALKGEREKLDPRFEKKIRPMPKKNSNDPADRRDALKEHQQDNLRDLDAAQKGLKSDEQSLEEMIQSLMKAAQQSSDNQQANPSGKSAMDQLKQMLRSEALKSAKQMAQRARQGQQDQQRGMQPPTGLGADSPLGSSIGAMGILDEVDPLTRASILQLPPRVREELLQGMKVQGPEGYQKFIQDYFRRLADVPK